MQKKRIPIILGLAFLLLVLVAVFFMTQPQNPRVTNPQTTSVNPTSTIDPQASTILSLKPKEVTLETNGSGSIDVEIATNQNAVTGVQLELQYDPKAITNVDIAPKTFFTKPVVLLKKIDKNTGRITYMLGVSPAQEPVKGNGIVAQITFTKIANTTLKTTTFTLLPESLVAASGVERSVLKQHNSATILLSQ